MNELYLFGIFVVVLGSLSASLRDVRTGRVPNRLSFSMIVLGFLLALLHFNLPYLLLWSANFGMAFLLAYLLWRSGAWAGGDAKLFWGAISLAPVCPYSSSFSSFSSIFNVLLWLATLLLIRFSVKSTRIFVKRGDIKRLVYLVSKPVLITFAVILLMFTFSNNVSVFSLSYKSFFFIFLFTSYRVGKANDKKEAIRLAPYISIAFILSLFFDLTGLVV
jgi:preflagellin peptidase FlaK